MALLQLENVTVQTEDVARLQSVHLSVERGDFVTIFGPSGAGKSTLLKQVKPTFADGERQGTIYFQGTPLEQVEERVQVEAIGYVHQIPEEQLVVEEVWHELAFGLENIGCTTHEMKIRIGEMAQFFGIQHWLHEKVSSLSGGQKQLVNLAATLVLHPQILLLDEPTAQLDPIAAQEFIELLGRIHRDLGVTVVIVEHRLEQLLSHTTRFVFMEEGKIVLADDKETFFQQFVATVPAWANHLPAVIQVSHALDATRTPAWTLRDGQRRLADVSFRPPYPLPTRLTTRALYEVKDVSFRYTKDGKDVLRNVSFTIEEGEILTIIGGNGAGKSTLLQILAHQRTPYKGKLFVDGKRITRSKQKEGQTLHLLPQDPLLLFLDNTVISDYEAHCKRSGMTTEQAAERIDDIVSLLCIEPLLRRHPADLSGGERQRVALGKLLLDRPTILLLDEPTKGLDPIAKAALQQVLRQLQRQGITLCIVTHDLHFAASVSDRCALFFDGEVLPPKQPQDFFRNNHFYTTAANQLAKPFEPSIILTEQFLHSIQQGDSDDEQQ